MKYYSLFSGIGGFELALDKLGHKRVGSCEWNEYARIIYSKHFEMPDGDASKLQVDRLPDFDILTAGFPCQAFSIAGKRMGFEDLRGNIFFEIARFAKAKRPTYLLLENVKGLLSHNKGETFQIILQTLDELGYDVEWQVCNTKYFLPQTRERVFIIGHLRGKCTRKVFPIGGGIEEIEDKKLKQVGNIDTKGHNSLWGRVYDPSGIAPTLNAEGGGLGAKTGLFVVNDRGKWREVKNSTCIDHNYWKGVDNHAQRTMVMLREQRTDEAKQIRKENLKQGKDYSPRRGKELVPRDDDLANCLLTGSNNDRYLTDGIRVRRLMPIECERLQGFPDNWTEGLSDTQRYKCIGNAVSVPVVKFIASKIYPI